MVSQIEKSSNVIYKKRSMNLANVPVDRYTAAGPERNIRC